MRKKVLLLLLILLIGCLIFSIIISDKDSVADIILVEDATTSMKFDKSKWSIKKGWGYAHRNEMLEAVINDPEIRKLSKTEVIDLLGKPSRINGNYLYYLIDQKRAITLPLHTKTLVIKFSDDSTIEWMKIHE